MRIVAFSLAKILKKKIGIEMLKVARIYTVDAKKDNPFSVVLSLDHLAQASSSAS
jgi:hypothetical protein